MGTIAGSVKDGGYAITTGVLVVASTAAVPDPLPAINAATAPALPVIYSVSSRADGAYSLEVRASTSALYNVRAFYPVVNAASGTVAYTSKLKTGLSVGAGALLSNQDFIWP
jgi:hypothetical protein